jgi:hypothetical protein
MTGAEHKSPTATVQDIRDILGPVDDALIASVLALGATREEILEANTWLNSDDYMHRQLHHALRGTAAQVFDILEAEIQEPDRA